MLKAWEIKESSPEAGGIPAIYLLKALIPLMATSLLIQGIAETLRNLLVVLEKSDNLQAKNTGK